MPGRGDRPRYRRRGRAVARAEPGLFGAVAEHNPQGAAASGCRRVPGRARQVREVFQPESGRGAVARPTPGGCSVAPRRRSEERRVGKKWVSTGRSGWPPFHKKKKKKQTKT